MAKRKNRTAAGALPASDAALAKHLTRILGTNDPALLASVLGELARRRGMREVAKAAGMSREALYKALRSEAQPRFETIHRVLGALGVKLVATSVSDES